VITGHIAYLGPRKGSFFYDKYFDELNLNLMPKKSLLITFGCSWTYGIGAGYDENMTEDFYTNNIRWSHELCYEHSWRKIVLEHFDIKGLNFAVGGSSNLRQFKYARNFFISDEWKNIKNSYENIVVLWGITTTERTYMWCNDEDKLCDIYLNQDKHKGSVNEVLNRIKNLFDSDKLAIAINKCSYNYENEIDQLTKEILFWDNFFDLNNIPIIWFDTFNSHEYTTKIKNLIDYQEKKRDILYYLCKLHVKNNPKILDEDRLSYGSFYGNDNFFFAVRNKILNPYSFHPTKEQYKNIGLYFIEKLKSYF
jgi:hypothetical protein